MLECVKMSTGEGERFDREGSDSPWCENERKAGTPLGEALFELLASKFYWQSRQLRKKKQKENEL